MVESPASRSRRLSMDQTSLRERPSIPSSRDRSRVDRKIGPPGSFDSSAFFHETEPGSTVLTEAKRKGSHLRNCGYRERANFVNATMLRPSHIQTIPVRATVD